MRTTTIHQLYDPSELRRLMALAPGGPLSIRQLAARSGMKKSRLGYMLTRGPYRVSEAEAERIALILEVKKGHLFAPVEHERVHEREGLKVASEHSLKMQEASHKSWARTLDRAARTSPGRKALASRFVIRAREMHPTATEEQIQIVADSLRSEHYSRLARQSAEARRIKGRLQREKDEQKRKRLAARAAELGRELQEASGEDSAELDAA